MAKKTPTKPATRSIDIAYDNLESVSINALNDFQGDLKELSEKSYAKLSAEIATTGFAFAPHAWRNPKDSKWYLVDGHQRIKTVRRMMKESGLRVNRIPVIPVRARSYEEAKRRVLQAASQYGEIIPQGMFDFMKGAKLGLEDMASFDFPTLDLDKFKMFFEKPPEKGNSNKEIEGGEFSKLVHTCPSCGHKFARE
jgi:hypothetical protein